MVKRTGRNDDGVDWSRNICQWQPEFLVERNNPRRWCFSTRRNFMNELPALPYMELGQSPFSSSWHHWIDVRRPCDRNQGIFGSVALDN